MDLPQQPLFELLKPQKKGSLPLYMVSIHQKEKTPQRTPKVRINHIVRPSWQIEAQGPIGHRDKEMDMALSLL